MYRNLGRILKPQTSIGLSKVDIPDPEANQPSFGTHSQPKSWKGPWVTITQPEEIARTVAEIKRHNTTRLITLRSTPDT
jgi:hypothetical protein